MQRHGGAHMQGNAVQCLTDGEGMGMLGLQHEMLLALHDCFGIGQFFETDARVGIFCSHRFVTEIESQAVDARFADHTGEHDCCLLKRKIGETVPISKIPQHGGAGTANAIRVLCVNWKGGRAAGHQLSHHEAIALELGFECEDGCKRLFTTSFPHRKVGVVNVAIVGMKSDELKARCVLEHASEKKGLGPRFDARSAHAAIELEEDAQRHAMLLRCCCEVADRIVTICNGGKHRFGILQSQLRIAMRIDADAGHGQHHIRRARFCRHLRFGDGRTFEFRDAQGELLLDERPEFVSLHMRTQTLRPAGDLDHEAEIVIDPILIEQERGRGDAVFVFDVIPGVSRR